MTTDNKGILSNGETNDNFKLFKTCILQKKFKPKFQTDKKQIRL